MNDAELREAIVSAAYLEGDFVLRSGKRSRYYLDKFRFETRPDILAELGDRIAGAVREHEPEAARLAAPVLGAVPLAAAASLAGGLPFVIGGPRGRSRRPHGRLCGRPGGGRSRRSRAPRRASAAPLPGRRSAAGRESPRKTAWLSRKHGVGRVVQAQQAIYDWRRV
jgi:hypothetical protein